MSDYGGWIAAVPIPVGTEPEAIMLHDGCMIISSQNQARCFENEKSKAMIVRGPALMHPEAGDALNNGGLG